MEKKISDVITETGAAYSVAKGLLEGIVLICSFYSFHNNKPYGNTLDASGTE